MPKKLRILTVNKKKDLEKLKTKSEEVGKEEIKNSEFQNFLDDLIYTAKNHKLAEGWITAGLASVQVGRNIRIFVALNYETNEYDVYINPEIEYIGNIQEKEIEGCLSLPGEEKEVCRSKKIKIKYVDRHGKKHKEKKTEGTARIIQHEYDHLNGTLFIEKL